MRYLLRGRGPCGYRDGHNRPKPQLGHPTRVPNLGRAPAVPQAFSSLLPLPGSAPAPAGGYRSARSLSITRSLTVLSSQAGLSIDLPGAEPLPFMLLLPPVPGKAQLGRPLAAPPSFSSSCCTSQRPRQRPAPQEMPQSPALGAGATRPCPIPGFWDGLRALHQGGWLPGHIGGFPAQPPGDTRPAQPPAAFPSSSPRQAEETTSSALPRQTRRRPKHAGLGKPRASAIHHGSPLGCTGQSLPLASPWGSGGIQHPKSAG